MNKLYDRCHIDIETFSFVDLTKAGVYKYSEDMSTEIMCVAYAFDDREVELWIIENEEAAEFLHPLLRAEPDIEDYTISLKCPTDLAESF